VNATRAISEAAERLVQSLHASLIHH